MDKYGRPDEADKRHDLIWPHSMRQTAPRSYSWINIPLIFSHFQLDRPGSEPREDELPYDLQASLHCLLLLCSNGLYWVSTLFLAIGPWRLFWEILISSSASYRARCKNGAMTK